MKFIDILKDEYKLTENEIYEMACNSTYQTGFIGLDIKKLLPQLVKIIDYMYCQYDEVYDDYRLMSCYVYENKTSGKKYVIIYDRKNYENSELSAKYIIKRITVKSIDNVLFNGYYELDFIKKCYQKLFGNDWRTKFIKHYLN